MWIGAQMAAMEAEFQEMDRREEQSRLDDLARKAEADRLRAARQRLQVRAGWLLAGPRPDAQSLSLSRDGQGVAACRPSCTRRGRPANQLWADSCSAEALTGWRRTGAQATGAASAAVASCPVTVRPIRLACLPASSSCRGRVLELACSDQQSGNRPGCRRTATLPQPRPSAAASKAPVGSKAAVTGVPSRATYGRPDAGSSLRDLECALPSVAGSWGLARSEGVLLHSSLPMCLLLAPGLLC